MDSHGENATGLSVRQRHRHARSVARLPPASDPLRTSRVGNSSPARPLSTLRRSTKLVASTRSIRLAVKRPSNMSAELGELGVSTSSNTDSRPTDTHRDDYQQTVSPELALVRKLRKERIARERRVQHSMQLHREKSLQEHEGSVKRMREYEQERKAAKLQAFKKRQEQFTQRKAHRELLRAVTESEMKKVKKARLRHVEMVEDFKQRFESPLRERQQQVLNKKKELRKPIDLTALDSHTKSYDDLLRKRREAQRTSMDAKLAELRKMQKELDFYKPRAATIVERENKERKLAGFERSESAKQKIIRKKRYGILVRELFPPRVSPVKRAERELRVRSLSEKKLRPPGKPLDFEWKPTLIKRRRSRSAQSLPAETPKPPVIDYLRQRRLRHEEEFAKDFGSKSESHWEDIWSDSSLSSPERITEVHKVARRLDSKAKHQEALLNRMGGNWEKNVEATEVVSKMYMESIRAKLAVLNSIE